MSGTVDPSRIYEKVRAAGLSGGEDVLQLAVEMERTGQGFYEALAAGCDNRQVAALCLRLASDERDHFLTFQRMLKAAAGTAPARPLSDKQKAAAHELVKSQVIPDPAEVRRVGFNGHAKDAVAMAVRMEKDAIQFYTRMRPFVPGADVQIVAIIEQERRHLESLMGLRV